MERFRDGGYRMKWLRDWWRGYSDEDIQSACRKILATPDFPGTIIPMTQREIEALVKEWITNRETAEERLSGRALCNARLRHQTRKLI